MSNWDAHRQAARLEDLEFLRSCGLSDEAIEKRLGVRIETILRQTERKKMEHHCGLAHCDGTRLGHELARDFPKETARIDEAFDDLTGDPELRVKPENLKVD